LSPTWLSGLSLASLIRELNDLAMLLEIILVLQLVPNACHDQQPGLVFSNYLKVTSSMPLITFMCWLKSDSVVALTTPNKSALNALPLHRLFLNWHVDVGYKTYVQIQGTWTQMYQRVLARDTN
jgi:hypothetical protein